MAAGGNQQVSIPDLNQNGQEVDLVDFIQLTVRSVVKTEIQYLTSTLKEEVSKILKREGTPAPVPAGEVAGYLFTGLRPTHVPGAAATGGKKKAGAPFLAD